MEVEIVKNLSGAKQKLWHSFLKNAELNADTAPQQTVLVWDDGVIIATGSRDENILKYIAVDPNRQGEGLTATVLTALRGEAFKDGYTHLFLYTKPKNREMFSSLFFYPIVETDDVLLMEDRKNGINNFLNSLQAPAPSGKTGSIVMNCNPFTLGHRYLIKTAASKCDRLYVFVLSEDKSYFKASDRMEMVRLGTADLPNVTVLPTGPYLISSATFPTYFLKDRDSASLVQCMLDIEIFLNYFAPKFSITHRFIGTEPLSPMTNQYNITLKSTLPNRGVEVTEIPRLEACGIPISASAARKLIEFRDVDGLKSLLPNTTIDYLKANSLI